MTFKEYQSKAKTTAHYPKIGGRNYLYPLLGLGGEVGELFEKVKRIFRDKKGRIDEKTREEIFFELGDILWYLSEVSRQLGFSLDEIAKANIRKLSSRAKRGKIKGKGDFR